MTKRYFVQTWGCQMNVYDSVRMAEVLEAAGWCLEQDSNAADLIVLNTCHIREKATQKVRSALGRIRQNNPDALVAVAGCVAQAEGALLAPVADVIVGPQAIQHLAHLVEQKLAARVQEQVLLQHSVAETPPSPRAIAAGGNASAGGNTAAGGNASAGGNTAAGGNASAGGDVAAGGNASVGGNATADGNASAGGNATAARTTTGGERFQKPRHRTRASQAVVSDAFNPEEKFNTLPVERDNVGTRDFLTIQEGCDKFCTFCVVPYTRGPEFSRSAVAIGNEAKKMVASGVRDLVLLGQNVNGWRGESPHGGQWNFGELMMYLEELLPDLKRMSYTTSHPRDMHDAMYTAHK
ncbi:MAG: hypothetical protein K0U36_04350, partial [Alphaproteobacteria bacterium]|nr:hypothetical protein [Alphaproteobacteria bacterium]